MHGLVCKNFTAHNPGKELISKQDVIMSNKK
jgi:hypothetical protein